MKRFMVTISLYILLELKNCKNDWNKKKQVIFIYVYIFKRLCFFMNINYTCFKKFVKLVGIKKK